jgi:hypothetical protein
MLRLALAVALVLTGMAGAAAHELETEPFASTASQPLDQMIYKGVAGNFLDSVPLDADARVSLQRANAVISNPLSWRSAGILLGITNPVFLIGGLIWGLWSASNIQPAKPDTSWLGPHPDERVGFCRRPLLESCRLHVHEDNVPGNNTPRVEHTVMSTAN